MRGWLPEGIAEFVMFGLKMAWARLFAGFMYASVGSFMARAIRLFDMRFLVYPKFGLIVLLAASTYVSFFTHHFGADVRYVLFVTTAALYWKPRISFTPFGTVRSMPLVVAASLFSLLLYIAENIGTLMETWLYNGSAEFSFASIGKLGSWFLLLFVSFVQVTLVYRNVLMPNKTKEK